jgi:diguanylate cyclase (GGDEF)-like protein
MSDDRSKQRSVFTRAWDIISQDNTIAPDEKKAILKLIQVIVEAREQTSDKRVGDDEEKSITHEVISKHSLMMTVKHQADELDALKRISLNLTSNLDLQKVLDVLVTEAMSLIKNAHAAHIFLYERGELEFGASLDDKGERNVPISKPRSEGLTYSVVKTGKQIIVEDMKTHPLYKGSPTHWAGSIVGVPLKFKDEIVGVMNLSKRVVGKFTRSELRLINLLADQAAVAIFNAGLYKRLAEMANTDSVTGLPNRRALDERLQEEWRLAEHTQLPFSVVMMDLDGFKAVNDTFGHNVGDELLYSLFNFLAQRMRSSDFLARYGGDELTLVMRNTDIDAARTVTKKIIDLMQEYHFSFPKDKEMELGITAGIATYPTHASNPSDMIRAADSALYHAKKYNRGQYAIAKGVTGKLNPIRVKDSS